MIIEYHRPKKLEEALKLLARKSPHTVPLGGGTQLNAPSEDKKAVVDLQLLGLDGIKRSGKILHLGSTLTLQALLELEDIPTALATSIRHENNYSLRQTATVAGSLVSADGRSPFAIAMLALDAQLNIAPDKKELSYGELLPLRKETLKSSLIQEIKFSTQVAFAYEYVARSPADLPILAIALSRWTSGRTRLVVGGFGKAPHLVSDGKDDQGLDEALTNILRGSGDQWASYEYRTEAGLALLSRAQKSVLEAKV
jgi:CO/xanthine dehydrogenase FAD-binding subunit